MVNPYEQYQNNAVLTASPAELTLMLYNGAIKFCNQGIDAIEKQDIRKSHENLTKAQQIIVELQSTLDMRYSVAKEMDTIYTFITQLLAQGNIEKNIEKVRIARDLIRGYRDTWQDIIKLTRGA
ncbi:MAG: flagellar export chaperone FliS [Cellulosilyticaceae bacterium]